MLSSASIGSSRFTAGSLKPEVELKVGGKDVEIDSEIAAKE